MSKADIKLRICSKCEYCLALGRNIICLQILGNDVCPYKFEIEMLCKEADILDLRITDTKE